MLKELGKARRILIEADLRPVQGDLFQPTGFADLGAANYQLPDGTHMLLVESTQSMANRLEATIIGPDSELVPELAGLSYIQVQMSGDATSKTNSLVEAHRLNSPFIISDTALQKIFRTEACYEKGKPLNWQKIAGVLFKYDVNSLLHGAFLANLDDGRVKVTRAVSAFIEARNVREAVSGGVKNNPFDPTGKLRAKSLERDVYSNVPYQRVQFTAEQIRAYFNLDLGLLKSYNLGDDATELVVGLALLKIRRFLGGGLRLRTACDFKVQGEFRVTEPAGFDLPEEAALLKLVQEKISACKAIFAQPPVTELKTEVVWKKEGGSQAAGAEPNAEGESTEDGSEDSGEQS